MNPDGESPHSPSIAAELIEGGRPAPLDAARSRFRREPDVRPSGARSAPIPTRSTTCSRSASYDGVMKLRAFSILVLASALVLTACDSEDEPQATPTPTPIESPSASPSPSPTPSQSQEIVTGSDCVNEPATVATGEVISEYSSGTSDRGVEMEVVVDPAAPVGCQAFLVAKVNGITSSNAIVGDLQLDLFPPQIRKLVNVDGEGVPEAFVTVQAGASTEFGALFLLEPDGVQPVTIEDLPYGGSLLAFGGSVTHLNGADCVPGEMGTVVISGAGAQGSRYRLERGFYRFEGTHLVPVRSETLRVSFKQLVDEYPEFSPEPFSNCAP